MKDAPVRPTTPVEYAYTGEGIYAVGDPDPLGYTVSDNCKTNIGEYTSIATLDPGFEWDGGGSEPVTIHWKIVPQPLDYPTSPDFLFDYTEHVAIENPHPAFVFEGVGTGNNQTNAVDAGNYHYIVSLKDGYEWKTAPTDQKRSPYTVEWKVKPMEVEKPSVPALTYNKGNQVALPNPHESFVVVGTTNATDVAPFDNPYSFTITFRNGNYVWKGADPGQETAPYTVTWTMDPMRVEPIEPYTNLYYKGDREWQFAFDLQAVDDDAFYPEDSYEEWKAGHYTYTLVLHNEAADNYVWWYKGEESAMDLDFDWEIKVATNRITRFVIDGWKKGSTPTKPVKEFDALWGANKVKYTFSDDETLDADKWSEEVPTDAGTFYCKATIPETANYEGVVSNLAFTIWDDPTKIYSDKGRITIKNTTNSSFTDYPLEITLAENNPPGFTYERAGEDGADLVFISADEMKQLPYTIKTWDVNGTSTLVVYVDSLPANSSTTISFWFNLRDGQRTPAQPSLPENPPDPRPTSVTSTYELVQHGDFLVDRWDKLPEMSPTQWSEGDTPTITINDYRLASGGAVTAVFYNIYAPTVTNVFDVGAIAALTSGVYQAVFYNNDRTDAPEGDRYEPLEYGISFRVVGHKPTIKLGDSAEGRILLMNNDKGSGNRLPVSRQGWWDRMDRQPAMTNVYETFWEFYGDDIPTFELDKDGKDKMYNRQIGTNCVLWTKNFGRRLWHLTNCRHGNTYSYGDTTAWNATTTDNLLSNQNYLPWDGTARSIDSAGMTTTARAKEVGQILMRNTMDACIYSPCYTNGVGTIYFDAVNGWRNNLPSHPNAYDIVVEVATETIDGTPLTEESSHIVTNELGAVTNDYANIKEWKPVTMYPVHYKDGTLTPTNATTKFTLAVRTGRTKSDFYRFHVPINHIPTKENPGGIRFRIRRAGYDNDLDIDDYAYLLVDNVLVSYPPMTATLHGVGTMDPEKKNEQTLGWEKTTTVPFPAQNERNAYARARSEYYVNEGDPAADPSHFIVSAKMYYRWRYLTQGYQPKSGAFDSVDLNPGKDDYRSMTPLRFPGGVGDVEYWFETRFETPYYRFQDYTGLNLDGEKLRQATGYTEEVTCTTNRYRVTDARSAGTDWFFRLREGKSKYEGMRVFLNEKRNPLKITTVPMELVGDGSWRGFLKVENPVEGGLEYHIEGLNPQVGEGSELTYSTNYWRAIKDFADLPQTTKAETCEITQTRNMPCDAKTGYIIFQFEESTLGLTVARADQMNFNFWSTAVNDKFVGSEVENVYSSSRVGESNINWSASAWAPSVAIDTDWSENFKADAGESAARVYPKNQPFSSALSKHHWLAKNAMWVHGQWQHETWENGKITTAGDKSAVQLMGRGVGSLEFVSATTAPKGLDSVVSKMRIAQYNEFYDFNSYDKLTIDWDLRQITYPEDMANYTFVTFANLSANGGTDYSGDGTLSLVGYYDEEVGCYEARISRGSYDSNTRIRLLRWRDTGSVIAATDLGFIELDKAQNDSTVGNLLGSDRGKSGAVFLSLEEHDGGTLVQVGVYRGKVNNTDAHDGVFAGTGAQEKEFLVAAYLDKSSARLKKGTFGLLSANCPARFLKMAYYTHGLGDRNGTIPSAGKWAIKDKRKVNLKIGGGELVDDFSSAQEQDRDKYYGYWKKRPGRLGAIPHSEAFAGVIGFQAQAAYTNKVEILVASHGGSDWTPLTTNTVSSFQNVMVSNAVHSSLTCDVKFQVLGSQGDVRTDVVVDSVELSQWCGQDTPGINGSGQYGGYRDFAYTGCWIPKRGELSLQPARAADPTHPVSLRTPLLEGLGLICFTWKNADPAVKLKLQLAEADTFSTMRSLLYGYTFDDPDSEHWTTLKTWTRADLKAFEDARGVGQLTEIVNHRAPVSGVLRLVIDKGVVERAIAGPESRTQPFWGGIQITAAYVWDLPAYSPRDWSGWNMRATGWANEKPDRFANIADSPKGYSGILNNSVEKDLADKNTKYYKLNPPCIQSPTFGTNCIGEVLFKARLYDVPRGSNNKAVVSFYGSNDIDEETGEPLSWQRVADADVIVDATTFRTYSAKFKASESFRVVRFAVKGVDGVEGEPGQNPVFNPPARVVLDSLCVMEQSQPSVRFREGRVRPFRDSVYLRNLKALPDDMITSPDQQPLLGEAFGFQAELQLEVNEAGDIITDDPRRPIGVDLLWYPSAKPWGYANWKDLDGAHRVRLVRAEDTDTTNFVFRSSTDRSETLAKPVLRSEVGPYGYLQYHMIVYYYDKSGEQLHHDLSPQEWTMPSWYNGLADPNKGASFSAFTLLEEVSPGRAWINEINYVEQDKPNSNGKQWMEIAVPTGVDMSGWSVNVYSYQSASAKTGPAADLEGPLFKFNTDACKKNSKTDPSDPMSHYCFLTVKSPGSTSVVADNTWRNVSGKTITSGTLNYTYPYGFELKRPSGIIEHRVVTEGHSEAYQGLYFYAQYTGTNLVRVLTEKFGERWVFAGQDPWLANRSLGVTNGQGKVETDWGVGAPTLGLLNDGQWIDPNWLTTPNGDYVWVYLSCLNPQIRHFFGDFTNQSEVVTLQAGGGTNITYEVDNFYELDPADLKITGTPMPKFTPLEKKRVGGKNQYTFYLYDVSNRVDVTAKATVSKQLQELGVTDGNPYKPAIMDWLKKGVTRDQYGRTVKFKSDTIYPFVYRMSDGTTTNLSAEVAYWLDVDITEPGWELRGAMGDTSGCTQPLNPDEPTLKGPSGEVKRTNSYTGLIHTNRYCTLWLELTNTVRTTTGAIDIPVAHPPWRLQGLGGERSDDKSTYMGGTWTSVTFQVTGRLAAPGTWEPLMKTPRVLRHLVFGPDSFRPADDDVAPFSAWVEVVDPFSSASPASDWGWDKWWNYPVLIHWGLSDDHSTIGASMLNYIDARTY